jgi:DNA-binding response OmpR family regulator
MAEPHAQRASVLLVEDHIDTADSLARFLRVGAGFDVRVAYDGSAGLKAAVRQPPDAIVCDIGLPKLNGLELAKELSAALPVKPLLIAVTGYSGEYPETQAREAGFDFYLAKPADPFVIEKLIRCREHSLPA